MYKIVRKNWEKNKYLLISGIFVILILLVSVVYKSNETIIKRTENLIIPYQSPDLETLKKFILGQIKSPFTNINYNVVYNNFIRSKLFGMNENINYRF